VETYVGYGLQQFPYEIDGSLLMFLFQIEVSNYVLKWTLNSTADLLHTILPATHQSLPVPSRDVALEIWSEAVKSLFLVHLL